MLFRRVQFKRAEEQDITLNISHFPLELKWDNELSNFINKNLRRIVKFYLPRFRSWTTYTNPTILDIIRKMASQNYPGDVFVDSSPLSEDLYKMMVEHQGQEAISLIEINPSLPWLNMQVSYTTAESSDSQALEECINHVYLLSERVAKLGGNLVVERRNLPIVPLKTLSIQQTYKHAFRLQSSILRKCALYSLRK